MEQKPLWVNFQDDYPSGVENSPINSMLLKGVLLSMVGIENNIIEYCVTYLVASIQWVYIQKAGSITCMPNFCKLDLALSLGSFSFSVIIIRAEKQDLGQA